MKLNRKNTRRIAEAGLRIVLVVLLILLVASCSNTQEFYKNTIIPSSNEITSSEIPVTITPGEIKTNTPAEKMLTPLPSALPTIDSTKAVELTIELLKTNWDCKYPCWWGITPGETTWGDARSFLSTFASEIVCRNGFYSIIIDVPDDISSLGDIAFGVLLDDNEIITMIYAVIDWEYNLQKFSMSSIVEEYGKPNEIWIHAIKDSPSILPYYLVLYYEIHGFMISYQGTSKRINNELQFCPIENLTPHRIWLWSLEEDLIFEDVARIGLITETINQKYLPIKDATSLTIEEFYNIYLAGDATHCFNSSIDLWPR